MNLGKMKHFLAVAVLVGTMAVQLHAAVNVPRSEPGIKAPIMVAASKGIVINTDNVKTVDRGSCVVTKERYVAAAVTETETVYNVCHTRCVEKVRGFVPVVDGEKAVVDEFVVRA